MKSKFLFHFFILESKVFTEGILDCSIYHCTNQKWKKKKLFRFRLP